MHRKENDLEEQHSTTKERKRSEACTELNGFHAVSKHSGKESKPKDGIDCIPKHCSHQNNKRGECDVAREEDEKKHGGS